MPPVVLTEFKLFNKPVERGPDEVLSDGFVLLGYRRVLGADSD